MRYAVLGILTVLISLPVLSQQQIFGDSPHFRSTHITDSDGTIKYPDVFPGGHHFPTLAARASVMSKINPSTETYDFREGGGQFCEPSTDWKRSIKWHNGSCVDADGQEHRFIERRNSWGDVLYFKCDNFGVTVRSLITERHPYAIGNPKYGETVSTRIVINGREVGTYAGYLPNVFIAGDLRHIPTDQGMSILEKLKRGTEGKFKLETSQEGRKQRWDFKFSLWGFKRSINWCTEVIDDGMTESFDESLLAVVDREIQKR
ncbi:MAG: hypothetical protein OXG15_02965 [Gammaproteobacteria bacterium]|nr:hypothetical protein [Gammaproteobacteria bacterium]